MNDLPDPHDEFGPLGRPLFEDPSARALSRVGVVDVGSNSVRMVVFDGAARSPAYFFNEKIMCGLGQGLAETNRLNPRGRERALAALKRFALLARGMKVTPMMVVATAAVREAEDGPEFQAEVLRETGLRLWVIDGDEGGAALGAGRASGLARRARHRLRHRRQLDGTGADRRRQGRPPRDFAARALPPPAGQGHTQGAAGPYLGHHQGAEGDDPARPRPDLSRGRLVARDRPPSTWSGGAIR